MIIPLIQLLTLISGLIFNFFIPLLFGLEQYGLFLKANILVFLVQKLAETVSEPLLSKVDGNHLLPIAIAINIFFLILFIILTISFPAGSTFLLSTMLWNNSILLSMYALKLHKLIFFNLFFSILLYISLLFLIFIKWLSISITTALALTNFLPSTLCLILLLIGKHIYFNSNKLYLNFINLITLLPNLIFSTLVNNLFTNILPFYFSFILPPQLLGLFKIQVSVMQSVVAIFPINKQVISTYFIEHKNNEVFINRILSLSLNYFYVIAIVGFILVGFFPSNIKLPQVFMLLPIVHASIILERSLLGMGMRKILIAINLTSALLISLGVLLVQHLDQIILLYALGTSLYLLLMLETFKSFFAKNLVKTIALITPVLVLSAMYSTTLGLLLLLATSLSVFFIVPLSKDLIVSMAKG